MQNSSPNRFKAQWLDYAWDVVNCDADHLRCCRERGGAPKDNGCSPKYPDLRFPGYYGSNYRAGGILCVALVHNGRELFKRGFVNVEKATENWKKSGRTADDDYLKAIQSGYAETISAWGPWNELGGPLKTILGLSSNLNVASRIAYTNTAKCWSVPGAGSDGKLMTLCKKRFPLSELCRILQPSILLIWGVSVPLPEHYSSDDIEQQVFRLYASSRPPHVPGNRHNGEPPRVWVPKAKAAYDLAQPSSASAKS